MSTQAKNHPLDTIRDGALKATIWKKDSEKGPFYSVELTRTYTDDQGKFHDATSYSGSELLRIARLADIAYSEVLIYRANDRRAAGGAHGGSQ